MDVIGCSDSDREDESQATQLLDTILDPATAISKPTDDPGSNAKSGPSGAQPPSRSSNVGPNYNFHGLAANETQTEISRDGFETFEKSQKENVNHSDPSCDAEVLRMDTTSTRDANPRLNQGEEPKRVLSRIKYLNTPSAKAVPFQSPRRGNMTNATHKTLPDPSLNSPPIRPGFGTHNSSYSKYRSSSPDSFADEAPPDLGQHLLATSKQFEIPLSQLGRTDSPKPKYAKRKPTMIARPTPGSPGSPSYASSHGKVLVSATPSASSSSQSQLHGHGRFQTSTNYQRLSLERSTLDGPTNEPMDHSSPSSAMSYSYLRSSSPPAFPKIIMPTPYSTSTSECGATQPVSQETQPSTQILEDEPEPSLPDIGFTSYHTAAPSANAPRSLLSSLSPSKQLRYAKHLKAPLDNTSVMESNPSGTMDQTQPSLEDEELARYRARRTGFPPRRLPSKSRSPRITHDAAIPNIDAMDVIPDSEASRGDLSPLTSIPSPGDEGHSQWSKSQIKLASETIHGDLVPDSMVVNSKQDTAAMTHLNRSEDEEDDLPLATMSRLRRKNMKVVSREGQVEPVRPIPTTQVIAPPGQKSRQEVVPSAAKSVAPIPPPSKSRPGANAIELGQQLFPPGEDGAHVPSPAVTGTNTRKQQRPGGYRDMTEIPSSVPDQDKMVRAQELARLRGGPRKPNSNVEKPNVSARPRAQERRAPQDSPPANSDDELPVPLRGEDDHPEIADQEYSEADLRDEEGSSRKRKRSNTRVTKSINKRLRSKTPASNNKVTASSRLKTTLGARRLRSAVPSGPEHRNPGATRIFALWKQDNHYYSGVVHSHRGGSNYLVKFDDETEGVVAVNHMRRYELIVGDHVLIPSRTRSNKVVDVSKFDSQDIITINLDEDSKEVEVASVRIASKTVMSAWKERMFSQDLIIPALKSIKRSPSPSKRSLTGSIDRPTSRGFFSGTGLVITLSPDVVDREKQQRGLVNLIRKNGGTVVDDWANVISMDGTYSQSDHRWTMEASDAQWTGGKHIERIFVLADQQSSKPKYLIALGLGVPCLSLSWIHDSIEAGEEKDWHSYMLPHGLSEHFGAILTQQVDTHWGNSTHYLTDIVKHRTPSKVFVNKRILCVGPQMTPRPNKNSGKASEKFQETSIAMLRIIFSMGAKHVEAVTDIRYSRHPHDLVSFYDYIVVGDDDNGATFLAHPRVAPWAWVKKCLMATRVLAIGPEHQSPQQSQTQDSPLCFDEDEV